MNLQQVPAEYNRVPQDAGVSAFDKPSTRTYRCSVSHDYLMTSGHLFCVHLRQNTEWPETEFLSGFLLGGKLPVVYACVLSSVAVFTGCWWGWLCPSSRAALCNHRTLVTFLMLCGGCSIASRFLVAAVKYFPWTVTLSRGLCGPPSIRIPLTRFKVVRKYSSPRHFL